MPESHDYFLMPHLFTGLPGLAAGFSTRRGGVSLSPYAGLNLGLSTGDDRDCVWENRRRLFGAVGFSTDRLAIAGQVHGAAVKTITDAGLYPGTDALVTATPGLLLCISAADCASVLLADPAHRVVGACHAGWRGTVAGIVGRTLDAMILLGANPAGIRAYVSPCISVAHFEVGPEVAARFDAAFIRHLPGQAKPHVDLKAALEAQLLQAGVPPTAIEIAPHCTFAETDTFFSHRAEHGRTGRMMGFIGLRPG